MRRLQRWMVAATLPLVLSAGTVPAVSAEVVRVVVDGVAVRFDQPPLVIAGRVLVPLRGVFEQLGAFVQWDPDTRTVVATSSGTQVRLTIGARQAVVNERIVLLDVPAMIVAGRTLVPLRFVSEAMGARVDWSNVTQTVFITSGAVARPPLPPAPRTPLPPLPPFPPLPPPAPTPPPAPAVVEGTVVRVDLYTVPPRVLVQRDAFVHTFLITGETVVRRVDVATNRTTGIALEQVRAGDLVRVTADAAARAILIRVLTREVTGRIQYVTVRVIVLEDGRSFTIDRDVRIIVNGFEATWDQLAPGMDATIQLHPQTHEVTEVNARGFRVQPPPPPPLPPPAVARIFSLLHDAAGPLRAGERITVTLRGTPDAVAAFDIGGVVTAVPLREVSRGIYQGSYVVRAGDGVVEGVVIGHLRVGRDEAPRVLAGVRVTIDTQDPVVEQRSPQPNSTVANDRPQIAITFRDRGGAGINPAAIRLTVNGQNVTGRATVSETAVAYTPPAPLAEQVTVRLLLVDRAGNATEDRYAFRIALAPAPLIRTVTVSPTAPVRAGETVTVTMIGTPGGDAAFTIAGVVTDVRMPEVTAQPGVYVGTYRIRADDGARDARVTVRLTVDGRTQRMEATARITIIREAAVPAPVITAPVSGARVRFPLIIRGRALPGYQVVVQVDYRGTTLLSSAQSTLGQVTATADADGTWAVSFERPAPIAQAELTITATAIDPQGRRSSPTVLKVAQAQ